MHSGKQCAWPYALVHTKADVKIKTPEAQKLVHFSSFEDRRPQAITVSPAAFCQRLSGRRDSVSGDSEETQTSAVNVLYTCATPAFGEGLRST